MCLRRAGVIQKDLYRHIRFFRPCIFFYVDKEPFSRDFYPLLSVFLKNVGEVFIPAVLWDVTLQRNRFPFGGSCSRRGNHSKNQGFALRNAASVLNYGTNNAP